jgi:hypothetical protein
MKSTNQFKLFKRLKKFFWYFAFTLTAQCPVNDPHLVYYERSIHRNGTVLQREETLREKKFNYVKIIVGSRQDRTRNMYETLPSERGLGIIFTAAEKLFKW